MAKRGSNNKQPLTLHHLLGAISFWGPATRALLFGFIAFVVFGIALSESTTAATADTEVMVLIYVLMSFVLLDFGYVMVARSYPIQKALDVLALVTADIFLALLYVIPKIVVNPSSRLTVDPLTYIVFVPIVVLSLRMLLGFLIGGKR